jgi:hypothetical protein
VITKRGDKTYFITKGPLHYDPNPCAVFSLKSFFKFCTGVWTQGLPLKPLHQPFFFCDGFFFPEIGSWELFAPGWLWTVILLISVSCVARIIGVSHWCLALLEIFINFSSQNLLVLSIPLTFLFIFDLTLA